ncbi:MAG: L,D-transpeptidase family protein, partial [Hyphomicrobiales bacterium]|nr:L,D-transpeptidase family protein [Hyphomicrobiales bacterium]
MINEFVSSSTRVLRAGASQPVLAAALVSLVAIALAGPARAEAPTGQATQADTGNQAAPAASALPDRNNPQPGSATAPIADCRRPAPAGGPAPVTSPVLSEVKPVKKLASRHGRGKPRETEDVKGGNVVSDDAMPTVTADTAACTTAAAQRYAAIADQGGWPTLAKPLKRGQAAPQDLSTLRRRLAIEGDLPQMDDAASRATWDDALTAGLKHYQARMGLRQTGILDETTLAALNIPASERAKELDASAHRLSVVQNFPFDQRYVVVNIPAAAVEEVENGRVVHRYAAVVGGTDHQSPQIQAKITDITANPTWTLPVSIIKNEVIPKMAKNPRYLSRMNIRMLDGKGHEVSPGKIDWTTNEATEFTFRQDAGKKNSLGTLKINMPNNQSVYMHDTPAKSFFARDYRFLSHGCVRVDGIYDLATWLLQGTPGPEGEAWSVDAIKKLVAD